MLYLDTTSPLVVCTRGVLHREEWDAQSVDTRASPPHAGVALHLPSHPYPLSDMPHCRCQRDRKSPAIAAGRCTPFHKFQRSAAQSCSTNQRVKSTKMAYHCSQCVHPPFATKGNMATHLGCKNIPGHDMGPYLCQFPGCGQRAVREYVSLNSSHLATHHVFVSISNLSQQRPCHCSRRAPFVYVGTGPAGIALL